jgi:hypothetical protein
MENALSPLQHALVVLGEEAAEVSEGAMDIAQRAARISQIAQKALRFGIEDYHPIKRMINLAHMQDELSDLMGAIRLFNVELEKAGLPPLRTDDEARIQRKMNRIVIYSDRSLRSGKLSGFLDYGLNSKAEVTS